MLASSCCYVKAKKYIFINIHGCYGSRDHYLDCCRMTYMLNAEALARSLIPHVIISKINVIGLIQVFMVYTSIAHLTSVRKLPDTAMAISCSCPAKSIDEIKCKQEEVRFIRRYADRKVIIRMATVTRVRHLKTGKKVPPQDSRYDFLFVGSRPST